MRKLIAILGLFYLPLAQSAALVLLLQHVDTSVEVAKTAVESVDASALALAYKPGQHIATMQSLCIKSFNRVQRTIASLRQNRTLYMAILLSLQLKDLYAAMENLSTRLIDAPYTSDKSQTKAFAWSEALDHASGKLDSASEEYMDALLDYAKSVDVATQK